MREVNLSSVDLNLLHLTATVLEERSATRAAARLRVTQSAVSNALRRARGLLGDALVVREAHGFALTPRATALLPELRAWVESARRIVGDGATFDPATSTRIFTVAASDSVTLVLLAPLLRILRARAPRARVRFVTLDRLISEDALARGAVDLLVGIPPVLPPGHDAEIVFVDPMECIVPTRMRDVGTRLGLAAYASLPHVDLALFDTVDPRVDRALARVGRSREVAVALPHFALVPLAVLEIGGVATVGRRLARRFAEHHAVRVVRPPLPLDPIEIRQVWHKRTDDDAAVVFLRAAVREAGALADQHLAPARTKDEGARSPRKKPARKRTTR